MKVAVDARMLKMSGIGTYIQNLMKYECYSIALGNKEELEKQEFNGNIIEFGANIYGIKEQFKFPYRKLKKMKPDILHIPHYNVPIFYCGKMIVTIHDLTHLKYPEFLPNKLAYFYAKFMIWIAIKKAIKIITVSENTKNDIINTFKVKPEKIKVIYNGVNDEFEKKEKKDIEYLYTRFQIPYGKNVLMYVGNLKPHKNLERLLEAFSKIKQKEKYILLLVGKSFANYAKLKEKEEKLGISNNVIHTGIVTQEELVGLYSLTNLFVFPSLYEGFGIPILEALSCGTPVICSNTSSLPEVGGDIVEYFDPLNVEQMAIMLEKTYSINTKQVRKWLENFNWKIVAQETQKIFASCN